MRYFCVLFVLIPRGLSELRLKSFGLDMYSGYVSLEFSTFVQSASLNASTIQIVANYTGSIGPELRYRLNGEIDGVFAATNLSRSVTVVLLHEDYLELLRRDLLATRATNTFLLLDYATVRGVAPIENSEAITRGVMVSTFSADQYPPSIVRYIIDMNAGILYLRFDEPMNRTSLRLDFISIQSAASVNDAQYMTFLVNEGVELLPLPCHNTHSNDEENAFFNDTNYTYLNTTTENLTATADLNACENMTTLEDTMWLNISLGKTNTDLIKANSPLATSQDLTFLGVSGHAAHDKAGNGLSSNFWTIYEAQPPVIWTADTTAPILRSFDFSADNGQLVLHFSETIDVSELKVNEILLQGVSNISSHQSKQIDYYLLQGGAGWGSQVLDSDSDLADVTVQLSTYDLDSIKSKAPFLGAGPLTTYISFQSSKTFRDTAIPPNYGIQITSNQALQVDTYLYDTIRPTLTSFVLNLDSRILTLNFDETVNSSSLTLSMFFLQGASSYSDADTVGLTALSETPRGSQIISGPGTNVTISLGDRDYANIKVAKMLALSKDTTYISAYPRAVMDMAGNALVERSIFSALQISNLILDSTPPILESYSLDLDTGILAMAFDEPVTRDDLMLTKIIVYGGIGADDEHVELGLESITTFADLNGDANTNVQKSIQSLNLIESPVSSDLAAEVLFIQLSNLDLNAIKLIDGLANALDSTFLSTDSAWITDYPERNEAQAISLMSASNFTIDITRPQILELELDKNAGTITFVTNEPIRASTINASYFKLSSSSNGDGTILYLNELTSIGRYSTNSVRSKLYLHDDALDMIKLDGILGETVQDTWLSHKVEFDLSGGGMSDMSGNRIAPINSSMNGSVPCTVLVPDTTPPELIGFDIEVIDFNITLRFDEPVDVSTLAKNMWILQASQRVASGAVVLQGFQSIRPSSRTITATPNAATKETLYSRTDLAREQSNAFIRIDDYDGVQDMAGNPLAAIENGNALQLGPSIRSFILDMESGILEIKYSEAIDLNSAGGYFFNPNGIVLQSKAEYDRSAERISLSAATIYKVVRGSHLTIIRFELTESDLETIRLGKSLSRGNESTYMVAATDSCRDLDDGVGPNDLLEPWTASSGQSDSIQALNVYPDITPPTFLSCDIDMNNDLLSLTFDEPMRASTLNPEKIMLRDAFDEEDMTTFVQLSDSAASSDGPTLVISLSARDAGSIKSSHPLAKAINTTFCALSSQAVSDCGAGVASYQSAAFSKQQTLRLSTAIPDISPPYVQDFVLDLNQQNIILTFNEPVNVSSIEPVYRSLALASEQSQLADVLTLTCSTVNDPIGSEFNSTVSITLCKKDSLDLMTKVAAASICSSMTSCFIFYGSNFVVDAAIPPNSALSVEVEYAVSVTSIIPDTTPPSVDSFSLDMHDGILEVTCTEIIDAKLTNVGSITLQSARFNDGVGTRTLSKDNGTTVDIDASTRNLTTISIILGRTDFDAIKALRGSGLALDASSVYMSFKAGAYTDISGNPIEVVEDFIAQGPALNYTVDKAPPTLLSFTRVSKTRKIMYVLFDEPIDHDNVNLSQWILKESASSSSLGLVLDDPALAVTILEPGIDDNAELPTDPNAPYSTTVALLLNDAYEQAQAQGFFTAQFDTYLSLGPRAVADTALLSRNYFLGDEVDAAINYPDTGGERATMVGPSVEAFALSMNSPVTLALAFTEPVLAVNSSLDITAISLQSHQNNVDSVASITLTSGTVVSRAVELEDASARMYPWQLLNANEVPFSDQGNRAVLIELSQNDVWALQRAAQGLAKRATATFLSVKSTLGTVYSVSSVLGNPLSLTEIEDDRALSLESSAFSADKTAPKILAYGLDMNGGYLFLNFSEPVDESSVNVSGLNLKSDQYSDASSHEVVLSSRSKVDVSRWELRSTCDDANGNYSSACSYMRIIFGDNDFDAIRAVKAGQWLSLDSTFVRDTARPPNFVVALTDETSIAVSKFVKDVTPPILEGLSLDLDDGILIMNFSEPVDPLTFNVSEITMQNAYQNATMELALLHTITFQTVGVRSLHLRLYQDLSRLKRLLALYEDIPAIGKSLNTTYIVSSSGYIQDCAYPDPANSAVTVIKQPDRLVLDSTGPRIVTFDLDSQLSKLYLYFDEPVDTSTVNSSAFGFLAAANGSAPIATITSQSAVHETPYDLVITLSNSDASALVAAGITGDVTTEVFMIHSGGAVRDIIGSVPAVPGAGPYVIDTSYTTLTLQNVFTGLPQYPEYAMPMGPVVNGFSLNMDIGKLIVELAHDVRIDARVNVSALTIGSSDETSALAYQLMNSTISSTSAYDDTGKVTLSILLDKADLHKLKIANGLPGASPVATRLENTFLAIDSTFILSAVGTHTVKRTFGASILSGVKTVSFTADKTRPQLEYVRFDMDTSNLILYMDEPVRAAEVDVSLVSIANNKSSSDVTVLYTLSSSSSQPAQSGAADTVVIRIGTDDMNEIKRLDGIATSTSNTFISFGSNAILDRSELGNSLLETISTFYALDQYIQDTTSSTLTSFAIDMEARFMTLYFDEPVFVATFNVSGITLQENNLAASGQSFRLTTNSYALESSAQGDSSSSDTITVVLGDEDYAAINLKSRLAKSIDTTRLAASSHTATDVAGNRMNEVFDGQSLAASQFTPDSTKPQLERFWIDIDTGILTLNFTEPVAFSTFDASLLLLMSETSRALATSFRLSSATTTTTITALDVREEEDYVSVYGENWIDDDYYGAGEMISIIIDASDLNSIKALTNLATNIDTTYLLIEDAAFEDMTGNLLSGINFGKAAASYIPDTTAPTLDAFDFDMEAGRVLLEFSETVDPDTFDATGIIFMAVGYSTYRVGGRRLSRDDDISYSRNSGGSSNLVNLYLDESVLNDLKVSGAGQEIDNTYIAVQTKTISDMVGLEVIRIVQGDIVGGVPLQARSVTADTTAPTLTRVIYSSGSLYLLYDEPVKVTTVNPNKFFLVDKDGEGDSLHENTPVSKGRDEKELILDIDFGCDSLQSCVWPHLTYDVNDTAFQSNATCTILKCDSKKAEAIISIGNLYLTSEEAAVLDYNNNPALAFSKFEQSKPECECGSDEYIVLACTEVADVVCAPCSTSCPENHYIAQACGERNDIGCMRCSECGTPFYRAGGCLQNQDTICTPCTVCKPMEAETAACTAGHDRVCQSCAESRECENPSEACRDAALWWRRENCCHDKDGVQVHCNKLASSNLRISARDDRRHWVFDPTYPVVEEGYELEDILNFGI